MFKKTISMMFIWILFVRICMSILSLTWYVPDETWQSVEVAHNTVFGTGRKQINMIIKCLATDLFRKYDQYVFKASNSCCVGESLRF